MNYAQLTCYLFSKAVGVRLTKIFKIMDDDELQYLHTLYKSQQLLSIRLVAEMDGIPVVELWRRDENGFLNLISDDLCFGLKYLGIGGAEDK